ncbi:MAG: hypothetical protein PCFJNLEI_01610 [Verrucomicrobiae bacterium]|nr:hypothetical protein [Verrucomicrobiae bacterium]
MNAEIYYRRIVGILQPARLQNTRVIVVGLGSGGSRIAIELGRIGVELVLVDLPNERVEEHNIIRFPLGYPVLGQLKNEAVASHLRDLNPASRVTTVNLDVTTQQKEFLALVRSVSPQLIMVCVDNEPARHCINECAVAAGVPQVAGGVYDGGIGGEVTIASPQAACYACIADHLQLTRQAPVKPRSIDYNNLDVAEIQSTCALNLDIEQIALIQARIGLHILLAGDPDLTGIPRTVNLCVFCNRPLTGDVVLGRPLHCEFFSVPRDPECLVCGASSTTVSSEANRILHALEAQAQHTATVNPTE